MAAPTFRRILTRVLLFVMAASIVDCNCSKELAKKPLKDVQLQSPEIVRALWKGKWDTVRAQVEQRADANINAKNELAVQGNEAAKSNDVDWSSDPTKTTVHLAFPEPGNVAVWQRVARQTASDEPPKCSTCMPHEDKSELTPTYNTRRIDFEVQGDVKTDVTITWRSGDERKDLKAKPRPLDTAKSPNHFSFLAFSCVKPFTEGSGHDGPPMAGLRLLDVFAKRAQGDIDPHVPDHVEKPTFALGLGDQIYVDPQPHPKDLPRNISIFDEEPDKVSGDLRNADIAPAVLREVYDHALMIPPLDAAFQAIPTAMMWDDHELGDGTGSRGNENLLGWTKYKKFATDAFWAYEASRNTRTRPDKEKKTFDFKFQWGKNVRGYLVDTRTNRTTPKSLEMSHTDANWEKFCEDKKDPDYRVLSCAQHEEIKQWLKETENDPGPVLFILGLNSPISWPLLGVDKALTLSDRLRERAQQTGNVDDGVDTWAAHPGERGYLLRTLAKHFEKNTHHRLLILSGDVHQSGISTLVYHNRKEDIEVVFGHEIVSSGLANHDLVPTNVRALLDWSTYARARDAGGCASQQGDVDTDVWSEILMLLPGNSVGTTNHLPTPSFAEIFVDTTDSSKAPMASVVFYAGRSQLGVAARANEWNTDRPARNYYQCPRDHACENLTCNDEKCTDRAKPLKESKRFTYIPLYLGDDRLKHCPENKKERTKGDCNEASVGDWVQQAFVWTE